MHSPQEIIESLLAEQAVVEGTQRDLFMRLYEKYYSPEYLHYFRSSYEESRTSGEIFSRAEVLDSVATVVTTRFRFNRQEQRRYLFRLSKDQWEIHGVETDCFACKGTGRNGTTECQHCGGHGWVDYVRRAREGS